MYPYDWFCVTKEQDCDSSFSPEPTGIPGQPLPSPVQTEGGRHRLEGEPGPAGAPGVHLPLQTADGHTAAGVPALHSDQRLLTHPSERPGGETAFRRGAARGLALQLPSMTRSRLKLCVFETEICATTKPWDALLKSPG